MNNWSLSKLFAGLHDDIERRLETVRESIVHPGTKGDANENVWLDLFKKYLPLRYKAKSAHIVDSNNVFSEQIDVVIFDRQYSPFIFQYEDKKIVPAESVYAVFEAKQSVNAQQIKYARKKVKSVRRLHRTSLPVPHVGGTYPPKPLNHIYGGILAFESDWKPAIGSPLLKNLTSGNMESYLDFGCVAAHGYFYLDKQIKKYEIDNGNKPATAFLFRLISELQNSATVPMIDIQAYAKWLNK